MKMQRRLWYDERQKKTFGNLYGAYAAFPLFTDFRFDRFFFQLDEGIFLDGIFSEMV
jgi:hypothetical protein